METSRRSVGFRVMEDDERAYSFSMLKSTQEGFPRERERERGRKRLLPRGTTLVKMIRPVFIVHRSEMRRRGDPLKEMERRTG